MVDKEQIDSRREYSAEEIADLKLIPWATNYRTIIKVLRGGLGWGEYGKSHTRIVRGKHTRYYVRGSLIKSYLRNYGPALMATVRKPKQIYDRQTRKDAGENSGAAKNRA